MRLMNVWGLRLRTEENWEYQHYPALALTGFCAYQISKHERVRHCHVVVINTVIRVLNKWPWSTFSYSMHGCPHAESLYYCNLDPKAGDAGIVSPGVEKSLRTVQRERDHLTTSTRLAIDPTTSWKNRKRLGRNWAYQPYGSQLLGRASVRWTLPTRWVCWLAPSRDLEESDKFGHVLHMHQPSLAYRAGVERLTLRV